MKFFSPCQWISLVRNKSSNGSMRNTGKGMHVLNRLQRPGTDYNDFIFSRIVTVPTLTLCSGTSLPGSSNHRLSLWATLVDKCD